MGGMVLSSCAFLAVEAFELQAGVAEVDEQADGQVVCGQIVQRLRKVHVLELRNRLDLEQERLVNYEIGPPAAHSSPLVQKGYFLLSTIPNVPLPELYSKRTLIDHLLKAATQNIVNFHGGPDDSVGLCIINCHTRPHAAGHDVRSNRKSPPIPC